MIRFVFYCVLAILLLWWGTQVKLGDYTCLGHARRIWNSEETQDLKRGVQEKATSQSTKDLLEDIRKRTGPVVDRVKRMVEAGLDEAAPSEPAQEFEEAARNVTWDAARAAAEDAGRIGPAPASRP